MLNKRGYEDMSYLLVFIVLNLLFFLGVIYMGYSASSGAAGYEQSYSKQIALLLDSSYPGMTHKFNFSNAFEISDKELQRENTLKIDDNSVLVRLGSGKGYSYQFFSNYKVDSRLEGDIWVLEVKDGS